MRHLRAAVLLCASAASIAAAGSALAQQPSSGSDILLKNARARNAWRRIVPPAYRHADWVYGLFGTSGEVRTLISPGKRYFLGSACKPHDCLNHGVAFLIATDGSRAVGAVLNQTSTWTGRGWTTRGARESFFGIPGPQERQLLHAELHKTGF
jgi:hypothetical protein